MELKKVLRAIDLALAAGRKRQSARTGFVHDGETIPLYENFCFALALFRQKTAESVTEGKELIARLLPFQVPEGNFPFYLHDYPRCFDFQMGLKVAPILIHLLRLFGPVLGELKPVLEAALQRAVQKSEKPQWENRYRACMGLPLLPIDTAPFSAADWTEWLITAQLAGQTHFSLPFDPSLQLLFTHTEVQERGEPRPSPVEWLLSEGQFSPRLLQDHPHQLLSAPLFPITFEPAPFSPPNYRLFWKGASTLHSLVAKSLVFEAPEEAALFTDISPETEVFVNGKKATAFRLGDTVTIQTPQQTIDVTFALTRGTGDFCGHISRANRPSQIVGKYEVYDWQIGMRTLRASEGAQITVDCSQLIG